MGFKKLSNYWLQESASTRKWWKLKKPI